MTIDDNKLKELSEAINASLYKKQAEFNFAKAGEFICNLSKINPNMLSVDFSKIAIYPTSFDGFLNKLLLKTTKLYGTFNEEVVSSALCPNYYKVLAKDKLGMNVLMLDAKPLYKIQPWDLMKLMCESMDLKYYVYYDQSQMTDGKKIVMLIQYYRKYLIEVVFDFENDMMKIECDQLPVNTLMFKTLRKYPLSEINSINFMLYHFRGFLSEFDEFVKTQ